MLCNIKLILPGQDVIRNFPKNIKQSDIDYFKPSIEGFARETTIKNFRNICVNNELFLKEGLKFRIRMESFGHEWQDKKYNRPVYQIKSYIKNYLRTKKKVKEALWCFDQFSTGGYFHWITEISPRLWIANQYIDSSIPLLIPEYFLDKLRFSNSFLEPFNRNIISFKADELVDVDNLMFVSQTGGIFNYQPLSIHSSTQFLKNYYLGNNVYKKINDQKVYISRSRSGKRMILNEDKIAPLLNQYGYQIVYTEELSLKEQIKLFSQTTHLLSLHGAGLSNMVFMPPNSKVIEIRHEEQNHMLNCFYTLAHTFQLHYYYVFGNNKGDSLPNEKRPEDKSIHVNIEMLSSVLAIAET
jgi:hypothetical protein